MAILSEKKLEKLLQDTGSFDDCKNEEDKQAIRDAYRKVEKHNERTIKAHGGAQNWYLSGKGRLLDL